ncbi:hypothetical protein ID866_9874 [Astraeus odoratus]|nr:hypothetical protein ID866_9874 [Astraeus odoratus]
MHALRVLDLPRVHGAAPLHRASTSPAPPTRRAVRRRMGHMGRPRVGAVGACQGDPVGRGDRQGRRV